MVIERLFPGSPLLSEAKLCTLRKRKSIRYLEERATFPDTPCRDHTVEERRGRYSAIFPAMADAATVRGLAR